MAGNEEQTVARIERLRFIELLLYFGGSVNREDLINRFGISKASASNLLSAYGQLAPDNFTYNVRHKRYEIAPSFKPVFNGRMPTDRVPVYTIPKLYYPISDKEIEKIALISRAIQAGWSLLIVYSSASAGERRGRSFRLLSETICFGGICVLLTEVAKGFRILFSGGFLMYLSFTMTQFDPLSIQTTIRNGTRSSN